MHQRYVLQLVLSGHLCCVCLIIFSLQHVEIPIPTLKKDEVLLKLEAASLNPGDFKIQKGLARPFLPRKLPHTPGNLVLFCVSGNYKDNETCFVIYEFDVIESLASRLIFVNFC